MARRLPAAPPVQAPAPGAGAPEQAAGGGNAPANRSMFDFISQIVIVWFIINTLTNKIVKRGPAPVITPDDAFTMTAHAKEAQSNRSPSPLESMLGIQNDGATLPTFPTHNFEGQPLGPQSCIFPIDRTTLDLSVYITESEDFVFTKDSKHLVSLDSTLHSYSNSPF